MYLACTSLYDGAMASCPSGLVPCKEGSRQAKISEVTATISARPSNHTLRYRHRQEFTRETCEFSNSSASIASPPSKTAAHFDRLRFAPHCIHDSESALRPCFTAPVPLPPRPAQNALHSPLSPAVLAVGPSALPCAGAAPPQRPPPKPSLTHRMPQFQLCGASKMAAASKYTMRETESRRG